MPEGADAAVDKAYRSWQYKRSATRKIVRDMLQVARADLTQEILFVRQQLAGERAQVSRYMRELEPQDEIRRMRAAVSARGHELENERALFNQIFGRPENFTRLKADLDAREEALRWREENVWNAALPGEDDPPACSHGAMIGPHVWID